MTDPRIGRPAKWSRIAGPRWRAIALAEGATRKRIRDMAKVRRRDSLARTRDQVNLIIRRGGLAISWGPCYGVYR